MKLLLINPNNNKTESDLLSLLSYNINDISITTKKYLDHINELKDELYNSLSSNDIIYFTNFNDSKDNLDKILNDIYKKEINDMYLNKYDNMMTDKLYDSYVINYTKNEYYIMYYNKALLDIIINDSLNPNINNKFNLLATNFNTDFNPKSNVIFGTVLIIKYNNHIVVDLLKDELYEYVLNSKFVNYYSEIDKGIYATNKINYRSIFSNDDNLTVYDKHNLVLLNNNENKIWMKYSIRYKDYIDDKNITKHDDCMLNYTDKINLSVLKDIKEIFSWSNITNNDIEIINRLNI